MVRIKMNPRRLGRLVPIHENSGCKSLSEMLRNRIKSSQRGRTGRKEGLSAAAVWYYLFF